MPAETLRQRIKPLAARFGITSSAALWQGFALREYRRKLRADSEYRHWVETEAPRWVADHWGHETPQGGLLLAHLSSQLYELTEMLRRRIGAVSGARVLDAGASDGFFLHRLGAVHGVGVNFLRACAEKTQSDGYTASVGDIEALPFACKSFDYVICCETLEHVPNPIYTLNELARVCRGRICISIPWLPRTRVNARPPGWPEVESHIFEFSEADFAKILTHANVRLIYQSRVQVFPEPLNPLLQWWFAFWMYPGFFPKLQYYEFEPSV